jgi:triacylglycerol lipase
MDEATMKRSCGSIVACLFGLVIGVLGIASPIDTRAAEAPAAEITVERNVVYTEPGGTALQADIYQPATPGPHPAVLVVHGGAWIVGNKSQLAFAAKQFAERGFVAMAINYRLAPQFKFPAQLEDCEAAVRFLHDKAQQLRIDATRIAGFGYSAGGHLVALLGAGATTSDMPSKSDPTRLRAVVAGGAPCDFCTLPPETRTLAFWLGGTRGQCPDVYERASPLTHVSPDDPPMLFVHGEHDRLVDKSSPRAMSEALGRAGVQSKLIVLPDKGHAGAMFDPRTLNATIDFFNQHMKQAAD